MVTQWRQSLYFWINFNVNKYKAIESMITLSKNLLTCAIETKTITVSMNATNNWNWLLCVCF